MSLSRLQFVISHHDYIVASHLCTFIEGQGFQVHEGNISLNNLIPFLNQYNQTVTLVSRRHYKSLFKSQNQTISSDLVLTKSTNLLDESSFDQVIEVPFLNFEILNAISS